MNGAEIFFGPAGWSYEDWLGTVYPQPLPAGFNHLEFLARDFDFVEVNTTFYRIPGLRLAAGWVRKTAHLPLFSFWIKLYQNFTHLGMPDRGEVRQFRQALQPLAEAGKLCGYLAQFPYSFKFSANSQDYLKSLGDLFDDFPLAIEFRHKSWDLPEVIELFRSRQWIFANIDQPSISANLPLTAHLTHAETAYFRLHGRNARNWFSGEGRDARYDYLYAQGELQGIAEVLRKLKDEAKKIYVSGNNHYKGAAVRNLLQLKELLPPA